MTGLLHPKIKGFRLRTGLDQDRNNVALASSRSLTAIR